MRHLTAAEAQQMDPEELVNGLNSGTIGLIGEGIGAVVDLIGHIVSAVGETKGRGKRIAALEAAMIKQAEFNKRIAEKLSIEE